MSNYQHSKDFIAFFLQSPVTKEPEYEIRITADRPELQEYQNMLREKEIKFRQVGLEVFPPPMFLLLDHTAIIDALKVLFAWYKKNSDKDIKIRIVKPDGTVLEVKDEQDIQKVIDTKVA